MRINRHKKVHKYLNFFANNYGFRKPFQVLIDGTFCFTALKNKVNIQDQLKIYLGADVKLLTTRCVIVETEMLGKHLYGAMLIVKQFSVHRCGHDSKPVPGSVCFQSMIGKDNPNRPWNFKVLKFQDLKIKYLIATQDRDLQDIARNIPGTPVMYLHQKTPNLEEPSKQSVEMAQKKTEARFGLTKFDEENISHLKEELGMKKEEIARRKKKKGGPNPLSCKKSKKKNQSEQKESSGVGKKRKRHRIKIPDHVKAEILKIKNTAG